MADRADLARLLVEKNTLLEAERDARSRAAVLEERARIARELHDLVAHSVSVMVVQAAAGKRVVERYPLAGAEAAGEIQRSGRGALIEMRRLFGMLHGEDGLSELAATPRMSDLEALLQRYRAAGLVVELEVHGEATPLSAGADAVAYRVVEEALDNVLAHAGPTRVRVQIGHSARELTIDVSDDGPTATARSTAGRGQGLLGMHERVTLYGGTLETGPRGGGGYAVHARLPRQAVKI